MPSQPSLRPFDIAVALRLLLVPEDRYEPLASALATSTSAVHRSVARLQQSGLCQPGRRTIIKPAFREFLLHGMRYSFPPIIGAERDGMPTSTSHPAVARVIEHAAASHTDTTTDSRSDARHDMRTDARTDTRNDARTFVWAKEGGAARGAALVPLFPGVLEVASRDPRMHELLATVDVLRSGSESSRRAAVQSLDERYLTETPAQPA